MGLLNAPAGTDDHGSASVDLRVNGFAAVKDGHLPAEKTGSARDAAGLKIDQAVGESHRMDRRSAGNIHLSHGAGEDGVDRNAFCINKKATYMPGP